MSRHRLAYLVFVIVGFAQLGTLLAIGDSRISKGAVAVLVVLVWLLGRRSRTAWWLFVLGNAGALVSSASFMGSTGGHIAWGNVITLFVGSAALLFILLSPDVRDWIKPTSRRAGRLKTAQ